MSSLFFTTNMTTIEVGDVERVSSITMQTYAGQSDKTQFRIGNDDEEATILIYSTDPNLTLSLNEARGYAPALDLTVPSGRVGSTIYVMLTAPLDCEEGERTGALVADGHVLSVNYFLASTHEGDTTKPAGERFAGQDTVNIHEQFESYGEAVLLYRFDPTSKPTSPPTGAISNDLFDSWYDSGEWCNPYNPFVGYNYRGAYPTKCFIGDRSLRIDTLIDYSRADLTFEDESRILIPAFFEGFNPSPYHAIVPFGSGITSQTHAYQQTVWTIKRDDTEFALLNIRKQTYFRGQFLFYVADLAEVNYPGASSTEGFLPWNQLYNSDGKVIEYVKPFSRRKFEDPYDPYLGSDGSNST
jgi:hypothetical protein